MSDIPPTAHQATWQGEPPTGEATGHVHPLDGLKKNLLWTAIVPAASMTVIGAAVVIFMQQDAFGLTGELTALVLLAALLIAGVITFLAANNALKAATSVRQTIAALRRSTTQTHLELWHLGEQMRQQHPKVALPAMPVPNSEAFPSGGRDFERLSRDIEHLRHCAAAIAAGVASLEEDNFLEPSPPVVQDGDQRVGVFVNLARRLQSLVHREIQLLDELEAQVEDPDLLKGLFAVDHLATRIRRHAENLAVLGGAVSRRQWSRPVNVYEILRSAVAEVEHYARVKMVRPVEGTLKGHAVADVIHLVAELVENATAFSAPNTQVMLRAQRVTAGLAIEVEDRGLGMPQDQLDQINAMLADPDGVSIDELLNDGRIGLYVVAALARRHDLAVQLQTNIFGGTQAVIVLSSNLMGEEEEKREPKRLNAPPRQSEQPTQFPKRPIPGGGKPPVGERPLENTSAMPVVANRPDDTAQFPLVSAGADRSASAHMSQAFGGPRSLNGSSHNGAPVLDSGAGQANARPTSAPPVSEPPVDYGWQANERFEEMSSGRHAQRAAPSAGTGHQPNIVPDVRADSEQRYSSPAPYNSGAAGGDPYNSAPPSVPPAAPAPLTPPAGPYDRRESQTATDSWPSLSAPQPNRQPSENRPQLPQRRAQTHLAPQLRDAPQSVTDADSDHNPNLMMSFQQGVNRADSLTDDPDPRSELPGG
ncbi:sensor histidine kinase [Natronoglycomyces albus]|uniref:histidine kinase n=1 Tax=Natronoglycomyces albus TaxID=2811108 RepID=A0A895XU77_9ACTN|nr:ATP-binding protein [Natronoglycomyces albus]QSB05208.1 sensor histidine kinase [Natronoglycomyces albus]